VWIFSRTFASSKQNNRENMKKLLLVIFMLPMISQAQTLEECQQAAERNYPLIRQYDLISRTASLNVENIAKGWLPQVTASAQATLQSDVVSWPEQVKGMYQQLGIDMKGLRKDQYKIAVDVSQMVYDGGTIRSQKELALLQGAVEEAQTEVSMYQVRKQVNEMYFALLLLDEQIRLNSDLQELLSSNERKLASMLKRGTAAESDYNAVKAERLGVSQQATNLQSQRQSLLTLLSTFCGIQVSKVEKPAAVVPTQTQPTQRPELKLVQAQLNFADAQEKLLDASLKPRLSVFASGFYGYPGYNMFEDMMNRNWSLGGIIGARLSWNIGALYTRKNDKTIIQLQRDRAMNSRDVFLFNNRLDMVRQQNDMDRHRKLMAVDEEMISLRSSVRKAAESKLAHGIIDVNGLVKEINAENAARVQLSVHEIEMLKEIYNLKYTINN